MKNFRTYQLAVDFYQATKATRLPAHLKNQLARAASSIALNLAEGRGRRTTKDQVRFFQIAFGSIRECQAIIQLERCEHLEIQLDRLAASTYTLIKRAR